MKELKTDKWILVAKNDDYKNLYIQVLDPKKKRQLFKLMPTDKPHIYCFDVMSNGAKTTVSFHSEHTKYVPFSAKSCMYFESLLDLVYDD